MEFNSFLFLFQGHEVLGFFIGKLVLKTNT